MRSNFNKIFKLNMLAAIASVSLLLVLIGYFMTVVVMPSEAKWVSAANVVLFSVPIFWATARWLGKRDAIILFVVLGAYALAVETLALATGFPYGEFYYSELLGYKLFGLTPITVSLAWTPLVLAAHSLAARTVKTGLAVFDGFGRIIIGSLVLVSFDLVIDPGAVKVGFWRYEGGGAFFGVPLSNYAGWLLTGVVAMLIVEILRKISKPLLPEPVQMVSSAFFITVLWTAVGAFSGLGLPAVIGVVLIAGLGAFYLRGYYAFDEMVVYVDEAGQPIGTSPKLAAHDGDTKLHSAFSVFVFNKRGELLLQQRALSKKTWPGTWSNSCCGHVMLHENVVDAAKRRLAYELGLKPEELAIILPNYRYRAEKDGVVENEICPVLVGVVSVEAIPNRREVANIRWEPWQRFVENVADPANGYSPWAMEETRLLSESPAFAKMLSRFVVEST